MIVEKGDSTIVFKQAKTPIFDLFKRIELNYPTYKNTHLIVQLNEKFGDSPPVLRLAKSINDKHRSNQKSLVIVNEKDKGDFSSEELQIVPTLQEAYDLIELEEIQRDLEF